MGHARIIRRDLPKIFLIEIEIFVKWVAVNQEKKTRWQRYGGELWEIMKKMTCTMRRRIEITNDIVVRGRQLDRTRVDQDLIAIKMISEERRGEGLPG